MVHPRFVSAKQLVRKIGPVRPVIRLGIINKRTLFESLRRVTPEFSIDLDDIRVDTRKRQVRQLRPLARGCVVGGKGTGGRNRNANGAAKDVDFISNAPYTHALFSSDDWGNWRPAIAARVK